MSTRTRFMHTLAAAVTMLGLVHPIPARAETSHLGRLLTESPVHVALHTGSRTRGLAVSVGTFLILDTDLYQVRPRDGQPAAQGVSIGVGYGLLGLPRFARVGTAATASMEPLLGLSLLVAHETGPADTALGTAVGLKVNAGISHVAGTPLALSVHASALKGSNRSAGNVGVAVGMIFD